MFNVSVNLNIPCATFVLNWLVNIANYEFGSVSGSLGVWAASMTENRIPEGEWLLKKHFFYWHLLKPVEMLHLILDFTDRDSNFLKYHFILAVFSFYPLIILNSLNMIFQWADAISSIETNYFFKVKLQLKLHIGSLMLRLLEGVDESLWLKDEQNCFSTITH